MSEDLTAPRPLLSALSGLHCQGYPHNCSHVGVWHVLLPPSMAGEMQEHP